MFLLTGASYTKVASKRNCGLLLGALRNEVHRPDSP
jgi:hypothetical protein